MRSPLRDRQLISIISALAIHVVIVLLLGLVDLDQESDSDTRLGPVAVRFEPEQVPEEPVPPREFPEEEEPPEPPEPSEPVEPPESPETVEVPEEQEAQREQAPPAASQEPEAAGGRTGEQSSRQTPSEQMPRQEKAEEEWTIPSPSGTNPDAFEGERRRIPSRQPREEVPASRAREGREERAVTSEEEQQHSEGSKIVYGEEEAPRPDRSGREPEAEERDRETSVFSEELMQDLESVQSAGEEGPRGDGDATDGETGDATGSESSATGPVPFPSEGSSRVDVELEGDRTNRTLKKYSLPQLSEEELAEVPGRVEVMVGFVLFPNGRPTDLQTLRSSGSVDVDRKVEQAVRTWAFSEAPQNSEPVQGKARIVIRAAE